MRGGYRGGLIAAALALAGAVATACGGDDGRSITVAAASDLRPAFEAIEPAFERSCGCDATFSFGSSGTFATQIEQGHPADIFASANAGYIDQLEAKGLIAEDGRRPYAVGRIVVAVRAGVAPPPETLDDLADGRFERIAIANPEHAPYGLAAQQALTSAGLWEAIEPRLVLGENATQAAQFVESGDADAGIVPLSLAIQAGERLQYALVDEALHERLLQVAAVIARSDEQDLARAFLAFIAGPDGAPIMERFGFVLPDEG